MDWSKVAGAVAKAAPILGTALGGPLGGVAGALVASLFGVEAEPGQVEAAIAADPEAAIKLRRLEQEHARQLRRRASKQPSSGSRMPRDLTRSPKRRSPIPANTAVHDRDGGRAPHRLGAGRGSARAVASQPCAGDSQRYTWQEVQGYVGLIGPPRNLRPRYNIAPSQDVATVRSDETGRRLSMLRWGLIPGWGKEPNIGYKLINARAETASLKPSFRAAYRDRRCLIPADGFYEWTRRGAAKQPYLIYGRDPGLMAFAGLWERWTVPDDIALKGSLAEFSPGSVIETCPILTTAANGTVAPIHHRMPVILPPEAFDPWLRGETLALDPCPPEAVAIHPVSTLVNKPSNDGPRA